MIRSSGVLLETGRVFLTGSWSGSNPISVEVSSETSDMCNLKFKKALWTKCPKIGVLSVLPRKNLHP